MFQYCMARQIRLKECKTMKLEIISALQEEVYQYTKQAYEQRLFAGTSGNLSIYDREHELLAITPSSVPYETMEPGDIVCIGLDGTALHGHYRPSSEWRMHVEIYKAFPEVNAVVHTHSPYATSFAVSNEVIPVILIEMVPFLGGDVHVAQFAIPGTPEVGTNAVALLRDRNSCLLANHGVLAVGPSLKAAHIRAVYVEDAAKIYHFAKANGHVEVVPAQAVEIMNKRR